MALNLNGGIEEFPELDFNLELPDLGTTRAVRKSFIKRLTCFILYI